MQSSPSGHVRQSEFKRIRGEGRMRDAAEVEGFDLVL
jgi:hypothetical protein